MDQLVLSKDATVELDGKKVILKEGNSIQVDRDISIFDIDKEFEIITDNGRILVESGDKIQVGGKYKTSSPTEFLSNGKKFILEKGDTFDVIEESFWEALKVGFSGKAKAQVIAKIYNVVRDVTDMLIEMHDDWVEEHPTLPKEQSPYAEMISSKAFYLMRRISQTGGDPKKIRQLMIVKKADPIEAINQIRNKAADIGAKELAQYIDEVTPPGNVMDKLGKVWRSIAGQSGSGAKLEKHRQKVGTAADGKKYIIVGSEAYGPLGSSAAQWITQTGASEFGPVKIVSVELEAVPLPPAPTKEMPAKPASKTSKEMPVKPAPKVPAKSMKTKAQKLGERLRSVLEKSPQKSKKSAKSVAIPSLKR